MRGFQQLVDRAKASGRLRPDFAFDDPALVLMANSGVVDHAKEASSAASRRLVAFMLEAFRTDAVRPRPLPPAAQVGLSRVVLA